MIISYLMRIGEALTKNAIRNESCTLAQTSRWSTRAWLSDCDFYAHINNGRYYMLGDVGRWHLCDKAGVLKKLYATNAFPLVASAQATHKREIKVGHKFDLLTRFTCWGPKWLYIEHLFVQHDPSASSAEDRDLMDRHLNNGDYACHIMVKGIFKNGRRTVPCDELMEQTGDYFLPMEPSLELRHWIEGQEMGDPAERKTLPYMDARLARGEAETRVTD